MWPFSKKFSPAPMPPAPPRPTLHVSDLELTPDYILTYPVEMCPLPNGLRLVGKYYPAGTNPDEVENKFYIVNKRDQQKIHLLSDHSCYISSMFECVELYPVETLHIVHINSIIAEVDPRAVLLENPWQLAILSKPKVLLAPQDRPWMNPEVELNTTPTPYYNAIEIEDPNNGC